MHLFITPGILNTEPALPVFISCAVTNAPYWTDLTIYHRRPRTDAVMPLVSITRSDIRALYQETNLSRYTIAHAYAGTNMDHVNLTLKINPLWCEDKGGYVCRVFSNQVSEVIETDLIIAGLL
jgi:hypothetical protein